MKDPNLEGKLGGNLGGTAVVQDMQWIACGGEEACAQSLISSNSLMAVTWRKRSQICLKWQKNQYLGGILVELGGKTQYFALKNQKNEVFGKFGIFSLFFLNFGRKKPFWTKNGPIFAQKQVSKIFFSANLGCKKFSLLISD